MKESKNKQEKGDKGIRTRLNRMQGKKRTATLPVVVSNRRREWRFGLPLKAVVKGTLPQGTPFQEKTIIENISSGGAYFCLNAGVVLGSKLNLLIHLPDKLTEGRKMRLKIEVTAVRLEKP